MIQQHNIQPQAQQPKPVQQQQQLQLKSLNHLSLYHTYFQRYYHTYQSKHQYVHLHTNGLFIIRPRLSTLPSLPVEIQYLLEVLEVRGKKKRGGVRVKPNTNIAMIKCQNGDIVKIVASVQGTVIQHHPNVKIQQLDQDQGYLAIILPSRRFIPQQNGMKKIMYYGNPLPQPLQQTQIQKQEAQKINI